jgi:hypothetical protein
MSKRFLIAIFIASASLHAADVLVASSRSSGRQVGQNSNIILRYHANGDFDTNWDTFAISCGFVCPGSAPASLLFDSTRKLWVATQTG